MRFTRFALIGCLAGAAILYAVLESGSSVAGEEAPSFRYADLTVERIRQYREAGDWCAEHLVPESLCPVCTPALVQKFKATGNWCGGHGVPESFCALCNPEVAAEGIGRDWCDEHRLPQSQCLYCLAKKDPLETDRGANPLSRLLDAASSTPDEGLLRRIPWDGLEGISDNPDKRLAIDPNCQLHGTRILLASAEIAREIGIEVKRADSRMAAKTLSCHGQIEYDPNRFAWISPNAPGIVRESNADLGESVEAGQVLGWIDSVEVGKAKADYLRAQAEYSRRKWVVLSYEETGNGGAVSKQELMEARSELEQAEIERDIARQALKNHGLRDEDLLAVLENRDTETRLPLRAPFAGSIVERKTSPGEVVERGAPIYALADASSVWLLLEVFPKDQHKVKTGMTVRFHPDGSEEEIQQGRIDWIGSQFEGSSRTVQARIVLDNSEGRLRPGTLGKAEIEISEGRQWVTIPRSALQWDGCCNLVFVQQTDQLFQPRKVRVGWTEGEEATLEAGLLPGEPVVTLGSYLLKTEILKGNLGAGCTCGG